MLASFCEDDSCHFKRSDFPSAFAHYLHDSRRATIENRIATGNGGQSAQHASTSGSNGGNRSAISTQDVGKEWRRRRRESTVVGGGLGVDSSVDRGTVRFAGIDN